MDQLFVNTPIGRNIVSVKIWRKDQAVIYSSMSKDVIGKSFASSDVAQAFTGKVVAEFEDMISSESAYEQSLDTPLIEVYALSSEPAQERSLPLERFTMTLKSSRES